eukprot:GHVU01217536.1.p1 GENE.GHVU01217536.1~~GHVU01217536.1.p1  ORF type:complete len:151 (-),score=10.76 GHVU01217536.1:79-531(-)
MGGASLLHKVEDLLAQTWLKSVAVPKPRRGTGGIEDFPLRDLLSVIFGKTFLRYERSDIASCLILCTGVTDAVVVAGPSEQPPPTEPGAATTHSRSQVIQETAAKLRQRNSLAIHSQPGSCSGSQSLGRWRPPTASSTRNEYFETTICIN